MYFIFLFCYVPSFYSIFANYPATFPLQSQNTAWYDHNNHYTHWGYLGLYFHYRLFYFALKTILRLYNHNSNDVIIM